MISRDNESRILAAEEHAPARLRRADVARLRQLFRDAHQAMRSCAWATWKSDTTIYLARDNASIAMARLGQAQPRTWVCASWSKLHELGLDVKVHAFAVGSSSFRDFNILVGEHRFRTSSTESQFTREASHLVRLGLGWCWANSSRPAGRT